MSPLCMVNFMGGISFSISCLSEARSRGADHGDVCETSFPWEGHPLRPSGVYTVSVVQIHIPRRGRFPRARASSLPLFSSRARVGKISKFCPDLLKDRQAGRQACGACISWLAGWSQEREEGM
ncbi:uncharacterized protein K489DRAFT_270543 [Dissoconium aciculare CBS 342.82]|uniref:Uncharacterized protein n=1 Tax=Dissoconium aciculare CBS 342.82 TaxID=1314786 RepID=A0A6J3LZS7_9PEZI|nr:uncharacterized protein K489DRAFT_270543 [Dissoconium aciculare CBS 342.82]KAF1821266.1 hypothetical protein K489DRAFT_270543 [Dissoconium aciculare CBS 342.82]